MAPLAIAARQRWIYGAEFVRAVTVSDASPAAAVAVCSEGRPLIRN